MLRFWLYFHYFSSEWGKKKFKYLQKEKKRSLLTCISQSEGDQNVFCFFLSRYFVGRLLTLSYKIFYVKAVQKHSKCHIVSAPFPSPCASSCLWSIVVEMKFSGGSLLVCCCVRPVSWGFSTAAPQCCPCCVGDTSGLVSALTFYMVCGCKYQSNYATSLFTVQAFPSPYQKQCISALTIVPSTHFGVHEHYKSGSVLQTEPCFPIWDYVFHRGRGTQVQLVIALKHLKLMP